MRTFVLIFVAGLLPFVWGWGMYLLVAWLWPARRSALRRRQAEAHPPNPPIDFQI